ncbi:WD40-repeat-containing domain protein [Apodospora peruviana]|uniref:WD40-repeat-containing domain protein n=1 Tax=Apodospora peruviana TaxID=516989 RepID=A0AAE0M1W9_9PEZI|nr:WD40-repeat-containing domain protein [Apodospora peruviana]
MSSLCGQLVAVDRYGKVQMVHGTAREFLLRDSLDPEFAVEKTVAHTRIAKGCFKYLIGEEMKLPRTSRRRTAPMSKATDFAFYACTAFSYHLSRADPRTKELFDLVGQFLNSNILTWIESLAHSAGVGQLISASRHLEIYYAACCLETSKHHPVLLALKHWTANLTLIAAKFGAKSEQWDDRISYIDFRESRPSALCYGDNFMAVSFPTGTIVVYDATSYHEHRVLEHGESVKFIRFKCKTDIVVTCGLKMTKVWNTSTGEVIHSLLSPSDPLDIQFHDNLLLVAGQGNYIAVWDLEDGARPRPDRGWTDSSELGSSPMRPCPSAASICSSQGMVSVVYPGQPRMFWDLVEDAYYGSCGKKQPNGETSCHVAVAARAFNPDPNSGLIAVAYQDGDLVPLDPFADTQSECIRANCQTLAASPDGRFLAAGGGGGTIHLLYQVKSSNSYITQLSFAKDSLQIADICGTQCSCWEPAALLRYSLDDNDSSTGPIMPASIVDTVVLEPRARITVMAVHPTGEVIFSGRHDGAVSMHCRKTAACLRTLYTHKTSICILVWCRLQEALLSVDYANRVFMYKVQTPQEPSQDWSNAAEPVMAFQSDLQSDDNAIVSVLVGEEAGRFMVSTRESAHLFNLDDGSHEAEQTCDEGSNRIWFPHPTSPLHLLYFTGLTTVRIYRWTDWAETGCLLLPAPVNNATTPWWLKNLATYSCGGLEYRILLELSDGEGSSKTNRFMILNKPPTSTIFMTTENETSSSSDLQQQPVDNGKGKEVVMRAMPCLTALYKNEITALSRNIAHIIGIVSNTGKLVFLDHSSWVCSADLQALEAVNQGVDPRADGDISMQYQAFLRAV